MRQFALAGSDSQRDNLHITTYDAVIICDGICYGISPARRREMIPGIQRDTEMIPGIQRDAIAVCGVSGGRVV